MITGQPKYNTALYLRLSKDDGTDNISSSIQTQKEMLTRYCRENGFHIVDYYIDDGWTGTNINRPSFQRMLADIEDGKINCVITKDLSRLGRNYLETGSFTEIYFPEHNVRYISVTDGVDTAKGSTMDITPFKNLLNDMYAKDISVKIKSALLAKQKAGMFLGTKAPYGYIKDPDDKHHLLIDERYAPIVRRIYEMAKNGMGIQLIAKQLSEEKIPRPAIAAADSFSNYEKYADEDICCEWSKPMIRNILRNPVYRGAVVGQKRPTISLKSKKRKGVASAGTFVIDNCHEPIIDPEEWELIQQIITSRKKCSTKEKPKYDNIFCGLLKCADCGASMSLAKSFRKERPNIHENYDYYCNSHRYKGKNVCSGHRIMASQLRDKVLEDIQRLAQLAVKNDSKMIAEITDKLCKEETDGAKKAERELKKANKRLSELDALFVKTYEEHANGDISDRNYATLTAAYEKEQSELEAKIDELSKAIKVISENSNNAEIFVETIKEYVAITELTQALLHKLIDKILVHEPETENGEYIQKVEVFYKFVGNID